MTNLNDKITLTKLELKTIMEDAFIDGWKFWGKSDWWTVEDFLEDPEGMCETKEAIKNLLNEDQT